MSSCNVVWEKDVRVSSCSFVGSDWVLELSCVGDGVSILVYYLAGEVGGDVIP